MTLLEHIQHGQGKLRPSLPRDVNLVLNHNLLGQTGKRRDLAGGYAEAILILVKLVENCYLCYLVGKFGADLGWEGYGARLFLR